jgi:EmrB/QacA subfamily drug resistance transporter
MARRWLVLLVTSVAVFMALLDVTIVNIAFPDIRRSFAHESLADLSWVLNAYSILFAAALVPAGRLADRLGRKRLFLAGVVLFLAASAASGLAGSLPVLVAARGVQAVGAAVLLPTSLSLVLPEFPVQRRALVTSLWAATGAIAAATGPSLGGALVQWQSWRWVFFVNLLIGLPALPAAARLLRERRDEQAAGWPDAVGALLLAGAVGTLALGIVRGGDWGWASVRTVGSLAAAVVLSLLLVARSARHPRPVFELSLFRTRSFAVGVVGTLVFSVGFFALLLANVLFLTTVWRYSVLGAGLALTPAPLMAALTAPLAGRLADRFGQRAVALPGCLLFGAGPLLLAATTSGAADYPAAFLPWALLAGCGIGMALPAFSSAAVAELPRPRFATGIAISTCFRQLGAVVGIAALVALLNAAGPGHAVDAFHAGWELIGAAGLLAAVAAVALGRVRARDVEQVRPGAPPAAGPASAADPTPAADPAPTRGERP